MTKERHRRKLTAFAFYLAVFISASIVGCSSSDNSNPAYQTAKQLPRFDQPTFDAYLTETRTWLMENRDFKTPDHQTELNLNSPFELIPDKPNGEAVLLVHGLGDSPYSFHDVAHHLVNKGYLVRAVLLSGHGSKAGDLVLSRYNDWNAIVAHHVSLLKNDYPTLWLGGYSTGANLVTSLALNDSSISGLVLFSPAFKPKSEAVKYAQLASYFVTWADQDLEDNPLRYNSLPMNGASAYYQTSQMVREALSIQSFTKPTMMVLSETDSIIDTQAAAKWFNSHFTHPNNALIWQGSTPPEGNNIIRQTMPRPDLNISNASHMGMLFSQNNPYYGINGSVKICDNGQNDVNTDRCMNGDETWYSAWGYQEKDKIHARLTFNPYFNETMDYLDKVMSAK
ncbi:alpha/beta hydrolase [Vibrio sp. E150_011]